MIRGLSCDGLISWALSFPPTQWAAGSMAQDVFLCVLDDIEPDLAQLWPAVVRETLQSLVEEEERLQVSTEFDTFLRGEIAP